MRPAGFAEAAHDRFVIGFEEDQTRGETLFYFAKDGGELFQSLAFTNVDYEGRAAHGFRFLGQCGELWDQIDRQVIDRIVAEVFENLQYGTLAGTAEPGDDYEFRFRFDRAVFLGH